MPTTKTLSLDQARRAVTIDFEGNKDCSPTLLGYAIEGKWEAIIVEDSLATAVTRANRYGPVGSSDLAIALDMLRRRAEDENRKLVAWSDHELEVITQHVGAESQIWWRENLINARPIGKRWARRQGIEIAPVQDGPYVYRHPLASYFQAIGYEVPRALGSGMTGSRMRYVRAQLKKRETFDKLTPVAKGKWTKVLGHNFHDCVGLGELIIRMAED